MASVIEFLERFNRKERFFLVGAALGNPAFRLSPDYRLQISSLLNVVVPKQAFVAMDFHLTWLYASVFLAGKHETPEAARRRPPPVFDNQAGIVRGNQEDIDLLIAFEQGPKTDIIVVEAKGVTGWTNKQMKSKAARLAEIFGFHGDAQPGITPHFVLTSPKPPQLLRSDQWPAWMAPRNVMPWMKLRIPDQLIKVSRSDLSGKPSAGGKHWTILPG